MFRPSCYDFGPAWLLITNGTSQQPQTSRLSELATSLGRFGRGKGVVRDITVPYPRGEVVTYQKV